MNLPATTLLAALVLLPARGVAQVTPISPEINAIARDVAQGWYERALAAERDRHTLDAEGMFQRAIEADVGLLGAHLGYARALDARGHRAEALQVLARAPRRAFSRDRDAMEYARSLATLGALDDALAVLRDHTESVECTRLLVEMASQGGRFPEALAAARRLSEIPSASESDARQARVLVRALTRLVADADAVRAPHTNTAFRRALSLD
jgi:tetratricopeptide (TPR) repeat protein